MSALAHDRAALRERLKLLGEPLLLVGIVAGVFGLCGLQVEIAQFHGCDLQKQELIPRITSLEGAEYKLTFLPLSGGTCTFRLTDGGDYVETTSWFNTIVVMGSVLMVTTGGALLLAARTMGSPTARQ